MLVSDPLQELRPEGSDDARKFEAGECHYIELSTYPNFGYVTPRCHGEPVDKQQRRAKLGETLAAMRAEAGLNQAEVASRLGKPQSFVSKYESAERRVELSDLEEITGALGARLEDVIARYREAVNAG